MRAYTSFMIVVLSSFPFIALASPTMTIVPNTTRISVPQNGSATLHYTVTNSTSNNRLKGLTVEPAAGGGNPLGLTLMNDTCTSITLHPLATCTFDLLLQGNSLSHSFTLSPRVCANNNMACSQASANNRPIVTVLSGPTLQGSMYIARSNGDKNTSNILPITLSNMQFQTPITGVLYDGSTVVGLTLSADGKTLYTVNDATDLSGNYILNIIDLSGTPVISDSFTIAASTPPAAVVVSPDQSKVYISVPGDFNVLVYDVGSHSLLHTFTPHIPSTIITLSLSPDGSTLYAPDSFFGNVYIYDTVSYNLIAQPHFSIPYSAVTNDSGTILYVSDIDFCSITSLDATNNYSFITRTFTSNGCPAPIISGSNGSIYAGLQGGTSPQVVQYDSTLLNVLNTYNVFAASNALGFDAIGNMLYSIPQDVKITSINTSNGSTSDIAINNYNGQSNYRSQNNQGTFIGG